MTGLGTRRALNDAAQALWHRAEQRQRPLALLMVDADHFKQFNDRYGYRACDDALTAVANCLRRNCVVNLDKGQHAWAPRGGAER